MRNYKGQFVKGIRSSRATEFKPGQHWRPSGPHRDAAWLRAEYVDKQRSAANIAKECGLTEASIYFWLKHHNIPRRSISQARAIKHWGSSGKDNPMYGRVGILNPNWQGGLTPARQDVYAKTEWKAAARAVRKRDKCCRLCGSTEKTEIHHIDKFSLAPLLVMDIGNMILLCKKCHLKMQGKEKRWRKKLFALLKEGTK